MWKLFKGVNGDEWKIDNSAIKILFSSIIFLFENFGKTHNKFTKQPTRIYCNGYLVCRLSKTAKKTPANPVFYAGFTVVDVEISYLWNYHFRDTRQSARGYWVGSEDLF